MQEHWPGAETRVRGCRLNKVQSRGGEGVKGWAPGSDRPRPAQKARGPSPAARVRALVTSLLSFAWPRLWPARWIPSSPRMGSGKDTGQAAAPALTGLEDPLQVSVELPLDLLLPAQLQEGPPVLHPLALLGKLAVRQPESREGPGVSAPADPQLGVCAEASSRCRTPATPRSPAPGLFQPKEHSGHK